LQFIPQPPQPACELCHFYPVRINSEALIRRFDRQIAKLEPGPLREKLQRLRRETSRCDAITLYLHGRKDLFTFPMLKAAIPSVTPTNWTLVRDYILYGPLTPPTLGLGSFFYRVADLFCSRKTMCRVVLPAIADLRVEYSRAVGEGQLGKAVWIRVHATWNFMRLVLLCLWRERG
jgi:hypothetical protein